MSRSRYNQVLKWTMMLVSAMIILTMFSLFSSDSDVDDWGRGKGPRVGVVEIRGLIYDAEPVVRQIDRFSRNKNIDAILVRIDSPGGTVGASQEIYMKLRKVRDEGSKPVVASMGSVAASGGVYVAMGVDTIMAAPGTTTGSIGVILDFPVAEGLLKTLGIEMQVVKSGPLKDAGSPYRMPTDADRAAFQGVIDDMYDQFVTTVSEERGLTYDEVLKMATGEVFTGRQAKKLGLIDLLGSYEDAVTLAGTMTGKKGRPVVVRPTVRKRRNLIDWFIGDAGVGAMLPQLLPQYRMR